MVSNFEPRGVAGLTPLHTGEAQKSYLCCSAPEGSPGCQFGPVRAAYAKQTELAQTLDS